MRFFSFLLVLLLMSASPFCNAHPAGAERQISIETSVARVGTSLLLPHSGSSDTCVLILGGSLSHTRDGVFESNSVPHRDALLKLAAELQHAGYASLRYDKVDHGSSTAKPEWRGLYADEVVLAAGMLEFLREEMGFKKVIIAAESAGAYTACLAAREEYHADGYIFLGALCGPWRSIYDYNFSPLPEYYSQYPALERAVGETLDRQILMSQNIDSVLEAVAANRRTITLENERTEWTLDLARIREQIENPPGEMFRFIKSPTLALAGARDLNVPPDHLDCIQATLAEAGVDVTARLISGVDHSFQEAPGSLEQRLVERYTFASFARPYAPELYQTVIEWLDERVPRMPTTRKANASAKAPQTVAGETVVNSSRPAIVQLAPGVEILPDITDKKQTQGVVTLEGRIGPLILGDGMQAHYLEMHPGMYVGEHPHSTESLIYTVKGRWVLCSNGQRHLMEPGTLFRFEAGAPTGYEVPFREEAYILVFKGDRLSKSGDEFLGYLRGMADGLVKRHGEGENFYLVELPDDHPARAFAREVNPAFEEEFAVIAPRSDDP